MAAFLPPTARASGRGKVATSAPPALLHDVRSAFRHLDVERDAALAWWPASSSPLDRQVVPIATPAPGVGAARSLFGARELPSLDHARGDVGSSRWPAAVQHGPAPRSNRRLPILIPRAARRRPTGWAA